MSLREREREGEREGGRQTDNVNKLWQGWKEERVKRERGKRKMMILSYGERVRIRRE